MRKIWLLVCLFLPVMGGAQTTAELFDRAKKEGNLHTQIELLTQVIEKSPRHVGAYHYRADAYQALGNTRRAILDYNKVISLRPKDPFRYYARGLAYETLGDHGLAVTDFGKAIFLEPAYKPFIWRVRARTGRKGNIRWHWQIIKSILTVGSRPRLKYCTKSSRLV